MDDTRRCVRGCPLHRGRLASYDERMPYSGTPRQAAPDERIAAAVERIADAQTAIAEASVSSVSHKRKALEHFTETMARMSKGERHLAGKVEAFFALLPPGKMGELIEWMTEEQRAALLAVFDAV